MARPLSVLSVCSAVPSPSAPASGLFVARRVSAMARHADVRMVHTVSWAPVIRPLPSWAREPVRELPGLHVTNAPMFYLPGVLKRLDGRWLARAVRPIARRAAFDVLDAHFGYPEGAGVARIARELGKPYFVTLRGFEAEFIERADVGPTMAAALRGATGVVCVSHSLRFVAERSGVPPERIAVIHNAIDGALFAPGDRAAARAALRLDASTPLLVSVGNLVDLKRHHLAVESVARARSAIPGLQLAILGSASAEPDYPERVRRVARDAGIEEHVHLLGARPPEEVVQWLRAANAFLLATRREGCCNAVLEALATGTPVLTTPVGDNAHFVTPDVNGKLFAVDDVDAMEASIVNALRDRSWDTRSIAARLAQQVGDWDRVARDVLGFFQRRIAAQAAA